MTTPILPTKEALVAYTLKPSELIADRELEDWFAAGDNNTRYLYITQIMQAWRSGSSSTVFSRPEATELLELKPYLEAYSYIVTITNPVPPATTPYQMTVSWA